MPRFPHGRFHRAGQPLSAGRRRRGALAPALLLAGLALAPPGAGAASPWTCRPTDGAFVPASRLAATARKLRSGKPLMVVALGSSSTAGYGSSSPDHTYPARLEAYLRKRFPGHAVEVINSGIGGNTVADMLARFERDVTDYAPDLVIWQVGTNALLRGVPPARYAQALRDGIARVRGEGADVILMNAQYAPKVLRRPGYAAIIATGHAVARSARAPLFDRFTLMHHWIEHGVKFRQVLFRDGLHLNDASYDCLGRLLARAIARGVQSSGTTVPPPGLPSR